MLQISSYDCNKKTYAVEFSTDCLISITQGLQAWFFFMLDAASAGLEATVQTS